jgi:hypothetical protein
MQVHFDPATVHERALAAPAQWAALSERMLRVQGQMPPDAAVKHLEAVASAAPDAFRVETRCGAAQKHTHEANARRLTGSGIVTSSEPQGTLSMTWSLRHLRAAAEAFPVDLLTVQHPSDRPSPLATPQHLCSLWLVRSGWLQPVRSTMPCLWQYCEECAPRALQVVARAVCTWLKDSTAAKAPVHDEALLLLESMLRRGLVRSGAVVSSNVMQWLPMQVPVLSNAALRCVAAMFIHGKLLRMSRQLPARMRTIARQRVVCTLARLVLWCCRA